MASLRHGYLSFLLLLPCCNALRAPASSPFQSNGGRRSSIRSLFPFNNAAATIAGQKEQTSTKSSFLKSLDPTVGLINNASQKRTQLLNDILESGTGLPNPGSAQSFSTVAPGVWRVVYAPHMTTMAGLARGKFSVQYELNEDGTIISHAKYDFPLFNLQGYLSVSGTYGSVDDNVCRVDFDEAWMKPIKPAFDDNVDELFEEGPYPNIDSVPDSITKTIIRNVGRAAFIEPFAVFPVSYLDEELIVFDFELLGTRICARRYKS